MSRIGPRIATTREAWGLDEIGDEWRIVARQMARSGAKLEWEYLIAPNLLDGLSRVTGPGEGDVAFVLYARFRK